MNLQSNVTRQLQKLDDDLALDTCSEPDCFVTIMVEKNDKEQGRHNRCTSCMMRNKLRGVLSK